MTYDNKGRKWQNKHLNVNIKMYLCLLHVYIHCTIKNMISFLKFYYTRLIWSYL